MPSHWTIFSRVMIFITFNSQNGNQKLVSPQNLNPTQNLQPGTKKYLGFSLIEMTVILVIVGVLLGSSVVTYTNMRDKQQRQKTEILLEAVQKALLAYAVTNGHLPCPDVGVDSNNATQSAFDGKEDRDVSGNCRLVYGVLPWQDLGVQKTDFYGNYLSYHVDPNYINRPIPCNHPAPGPTLLNVETNNHGVVSNLDAIVAVVVSFGKNGAGHLLPTPAGSPAYITRAAVTGDEARNADYIYNGDPTANNSYVQGVGDDMLTFISPITLRSKPEIACQ